MKCYHFGKIGHMKRNCKILNQGGDKSQKQEDDKNIVVQQVPMTMRWPYFAINFFFCHVAEQDVKWVMDSAASDHCVPKREYFSTYKARDFSTVKMGNKSVS